MTNKEKFKEVFGFTPVKTEDYCPCGYLTCMGCPARHDDNEECGTYWWNKEYKENK